MSAELHKSKSIFLLCYFMVIASVLTAQIPSDTVIIPKTVPKKITAADSLKLVHSPRKAATRSALVPGWGQYYNKKYWKIPFVYGALGTTAYIFTYNVKEYKLLRKAFIYRTDTVPANDALIDPRFAGLSNESIRSYRNSFRQNVDYSVLFFILFWGLNVVDATVDAHLKAFDVSDDLSFKINPGYSDLGNTTGISLVLKIKDKSAKQAKVYPK